MTKSEKAVIQSVRNTLVGASKPGFTTGDIKEWSTWANRMQTVMHTNIEILDGILSIDPVEEEKDGEVSL